MIHLCQNKGCKNIASCSCLCKTEARYYCSDHFKSHLLEDLTAQHQIQPCYIDISSNEKAAIITKAQTMIRTLADYKRKVILHSIEWISKVKIQTDEIILQIEKYIDYCFQMCQISNDHRFQVESILGNFIKNRHNTLIRQLENWESPNFNIFQYQPPDLFSLGPFYNIKSTPELKEDENLDYLTVNLGISESISNQILFVGANTDVLFSYDVQNGFIKKINNQIPIDMGWNAGTCELLNGKIFQVGGMRSDCKINSCFIIDPDKSTFEQLSSYKYWSNPALVSYNHLIYVFGGSGGNASIECDRFNLYTKQWESISPCPAPSEYMTAAIYDNSILVVGCAHSKVYSYDMSSDSYTAILDCKSNKFKILIAYNENAYLLSDGMLYIKKKNESNMWTRWNENIEYRNEYGWIVSNTVRYQNSVYFLTLNVNKMYHRWQFDLDTNLVILLGSDKLKNLGGIAGKFWNMLGY